MANKLKFNKDKTEVIPSSTHLNVRLLNVASMCIDGETAPLSEKVKKPRCPFRTDIFQCKHKWNTYVFPCCSCPQYLFLLHSLSSMSTTRNGFAQTTPVMKENDAMGSLQFTGWHRLLKARHVSWRQGQTANLLDLFLTTVPTYSSLHSSTTYSPLESSCHSVVVVKMYSKCKESNDAPFHRTVFRYSEACWDSLRLFSFFF